MEPVPYEIREDDVDEVLNSYEPTGGGDWDEQARIEARRHVMRNVTDIDDIVRSAPEDRYGRGQSPPEPSGPVGDRPGDREPQRRGMALAAIEDLLIRDGFIDIAADERRVFPATTQHDTERPDR